MRRLIRSPLFDYNMLYYNLNRNENTTQQPLKRKWACPIDNSEIIVSDKTLHLKDTMAFFQTRLY